MASMKKMEKAFKITSVCRLDVAEALGETGGSTKESEDFAKSLSDDEMHWISRKLADAYCEYMFWDSLKALCDDLKDTRAGKWKS